MDPQIAPHLHRSALVTIDMQRDVLDGAPLEVTGTSAALPHVIRLTEAFRAFGRPIVHIVRLYAADGSNAEPVRRTLVSGDTPLLRPGTPGRLLAPGLTDVDLDDEFLLSGSAQRLGPHEIALYKPRWGAFYRTDLDERLRANGCDTIVFAGANFPNCPRTSIYQASERDYRIALATDAVSGLTVDGRIELAGIGVALHTVAELVAEM